MRMKQTCIGASAVLMLGLLAGTAHAAPLGAGPTARATGAGASAVETVAHRRCWIDDGVRHCRLVPDAYDEGFGYYDYDEPGYGYGPGVGFFFGGRGRHGHFHGGGGGFHGGGGGFHGGGGGHHR
jgi:hypothetical protein